MAGSPELQTSAADAILKRIEGQATGSLNPTSILSVAQAYAAVVNAKDGATGSDEQAD